MFQSPTYSPPEKDLNEALRDLARRQDEMATEVARRARR